MPTDLDPALAQNQLWFKLPDAEAGPAAVQLFKRIEEEQAGRRDQNLRQAMAWANRELDSLYDLATAAPDSAIEPWNICQVATATGSAYVTRNKVKLLFETSGANVKLRRHAREASRWINGVMAANKVQDDIAPQCFEDAGICDAGFCVSRVQERNGVRRIETERCFPDEVIFSDAETLYGKVWQFALKKYYPKHTILEEYGKTELKRAAILKESNDCPAFTTSYKPDLIPVWECWAVNGKHLVAVSDATLECWPWKHPRVPLTPWYIEKPKAGMWGIGWCNQLYGYQIDLFELNEAIGEQIRHSSSKWMVKSGSNVNPAELNSRNAGIVNYATEAPKLETPKAVNKDLLDERQRTWEQSLKQIGLSEWGATGANPGKNLSGDALEQLRDREVGRLITQGQNYEASHSDLGEVYIMLGPSCSDWKVQGQGPGDRDMQDVNFAQIAKLIKEAPWSVQPPAPVAAFPSSPSGKRAAIDRYVERGIMTPEAAAMALDLPDVDAEASLISSLREEVLNLIDDILEDGQEGYQAPELVMVQVGGTMPAQLFAKEYFRAKRQKVEQEKLDLLLQWIDEANALLKQIQQPAQPAPQLQQVQMGGATFGMPGIPGGAPAAAAAALPAALPPVTNPALPSEAISPVAPGA